jgi:NADH-quinone oxidoreductase subunit F
MDPLASALKYFRDDFEQHIGAGHCPWRAEVMPVAHSIA